MGATNEQIEAALRYNEIGTGDPYKLSFAGLAHSGASVGEFQADLSQRPDALSAIGNLLAALPNVTTIMAALGEPCTHCPLSAEDLETVNAVLRGSAGRATIVSLDGASLATVLTELSRVRAAAASRSLSLTADAELAISCWINMSGAPTTLDEWLSGVTAHMAAGSDVPPAAGSVVSAAAIYGYLSLTGFYSQHPQNLNHLKASVAAGLAVPGVPSVL